MATQGGVPAGPDGGTKPAADQHTGSGGKNDYSSETAAGTWKIEREGGEDARAEVAAAEKEADRTNEFQEKQDPDFKPE